MGSDIFFRLFDSLVKRLFFGAQLLQVMRDFRFLFFKHVSFFPTADGTLLVSTPKTGYPLPTPQGSDYAGCVIPLYFLLTTPLRRPPPPNLF